MNRNWWANPRLGFVAIVVFAAVARLTHLAWDQNHFFHPDERAVTGSVMQLSFKPLQWNPHFFAYGSLPIYLTKITTSAVAHITPWAASYDGVTLNGRRLSAVIGTLTVLVLMLLGSRLYDRTVGLLAGFLLAACVLHIQNSRFLTVDITLTFCVLLCLYQLVRVSAEGRTTQFVLAGVFIGLAVATKFSAMPLLLPLGIAALHRYVVERRLVPIAGRCLLAVLAAAAAFALAEPYAVMDFRAFFHDLMEQSGMVRNAGVFPYTTQYMGTPKYWYDLTQLVLWGMAPALGLAAVWGSLMRVGIAWREKRAEDWILLSWVVPFFLITGWFEVKFPRYLLPIYPLMILWAAEWLVRRYRRGTLLGRVALPVVVLGTLAAAFAFMSIYTRPHPVVTASEWVYKHIPPGTKILTQHWDEGFPMPLPIPEAAAARYQVVEEGYYEADNSSKIQKLSQDLADAEYVAFQTKRLYGAVTRAPQKFPLTTNYFYEFFAGDLGYTLIYEAASRPSLFGIEIPDELADESLTVYDHPKVLIFHNTGKLSAAVINDKILHGLPSRRLTRDDLLLARPSGEQPLGASGAAPPIQSSVLALVLFAALVEILSLAVYPVLRTWFSGVGTLALSKTLGVLLFSYVSWLLISLDVASFTLGTLNAIAVAFVVIGALVWRRGVRVPQSRAEIVATECLFWGAFAFFLCIRMWNPEVFWGEKPMDFSFLNALTRATTLPPPEPWFAGSPLQYSYFGHYIIAALGKTLHLHPALTFNLGIALVAALTAAAAFAAGGAVAGRWQTGVLAAFFTVLIGNLAGPREVFGPHPVINFDYFWATSRVVRDTINEFPLWSFLFADLHAHLLVMPISLTFLALTVLWVRSRIMHSEPPRSSGFTAALLAPVELVLLGVTLGAITVTNTWSAPTYVLFFIFLVGSVWLTETEHRGIFGLLFGAIWRVLVPCAVVVGAAVLFYLPFWSHFTPPERNFGWERLPPDKLALPHDFLTIFGVFVCVVVPFLFVLWTRSVRRGDDAPLGRARGVLLVLVIGLLLGSVAVSTRAFSAILFLLGLQLVLAPNTDSRWRIPLAMATFAFAITAGCDLVYVWDRMNTLFKFYLEAWFFLAVAGATAAQAMWSGELQLPRIRRVWQLALALLVAVGLFTTTTDIYGVIKTNRVQTPKPTLDGMAYLREKAPYELAAYEWLNTYIQGIPVILEAHGDSYQEFTRVAMNTGLPTVLGWGYHVYQRGHSWPDINRRKADIETIYTTDSKDVVSTLLQRYHVALVYVGALERRTYANANLERFNQWSDLLTPVYRNSGVTVFAVNGRFTGTMPVTTIEEIPQVAGEEAPAAQDAAGRLHQPRGVAVGTDGNIVVCDFGNNRIQEFTKELALVRQWGSRGELPGQFKDPCGVAVSPSGEVYVADTWGQRVQVFSKTGEFVREWSAGFYGPRGIAIDADGSVVVADTGNNRIVRFSSAGQKQKEWGSKGNGEGQFWEPTGVAIDAAGKVYVSDNGNGRLQIFTRDGELVGVFPVPGWQSKVYSEPYIAIDPRGTIWVTVSGEKEVRNYDASGKLLRTITGKSIPGVSFETPMGIAYSPATQQLIISELENRLVRIPLAGEVPPPAPAAAPRAPAPKRK